jgi:hypothetical protein
VGKWEEEANTHRNEAWLDATATHLYDILRISLSLFSLCSSIALMFIYFQCVQMFVTYETSELIACIILGGSFDLDMSDDVVTLELMHVFEYKM